MGLKYLSVHQQRFDICYLWRRITFSAGTLDRFNLPRRVDDVLGTSIDNLVHLLHMIRNLVG